MVHGTFAKNTFSILQDGHLGGYKKNNQTMLEEPVGQIFTQIIYKDMPFESNQKPFWWDDCFVLSTKILKDKQFYGIGKFCDKFEDCMDDDHTPKPDIKEKGQLTKIPSLTKFKKKLNKHLKNSADLGTLRFTHSHEILFKNKINLKKYCIALILYSNKHKNYKKIVKLANKLNIKVFIIKEVGINNLINLINH